VLLVFSRFVTREVANNGYAAVFLLMLLESACVPIPSEVTMLFAGALTTSAFAGAGQQLGLGEVVALGVAGNLAGSLVAYAVGALGGRPLVDRYGRYLLILPHEVDRAHAWFDRRGELAVFVARLLPVVRTFISLPAGIARMRVGRFVAYTIAGCIPWTLALALIGRALGSRWSRAENVLKPISYLLAAAIVVGIVVWVSRRWKRVRAEYSRLDAAQR
jgi:membrane protein DedA with SNARE-associated domain